jgi:hypothetical protein
MRLWPVLAIGLLAPLGAMAETLSGYISDSRCGTKRAALSAADVQDIKSCIKQGATPVLVVGERVIPLLYTSVEKAMPFVGQKVVVTGSIERGRRGDELLTIEKIEKAK